MSLNTYSISLISASSIEYTNSNNNNNNNNNDMKLSSGMYTASEQRKARTKTTLIKFFLSRNIRSLRNTTHTNERYVLIAGYRRQLYKNKY